MGVGRRLEERGTEEPNRMVTRWRCLEDRVRKGRDTGSDQLVRSGWWGAVMAVALLSASCVARLPIVIDPAYPEYLYPPVPGEYEGSEVATRHEEAWTYFQAGDLVTAQARYTVLLERTPDFHPAVTALGWLSLARDDHAAAAEHFTRATDADPMSVSALVGHGRAMLGLGRSADALPLFESALAVEPGLPGLGREVEALRFAVVSQELATAREAAEAGRFAAATEAYERVIAASPDSGFLHVELGRLEQQRGDLTAALRHAEEAARLDPQDGAAFLLQGEIYEANEDLPSALTAYERADAADPTGETASHIDRVVRLMFLAELPSEVGEIPSKPSVTRGDLAALVGVRFMELLAKGRDRPVIITDTRDHWGGEWIQSVSDAGVMDVDAAYRFNPSGPVRRGDLAEIVVKTLDLIESQGMDDRQPDGGQPLTFTDMSATHLSYGAAQRAVVAGVMAALDNDTFQPSRLVTGQEAVETVDRLADLALDSR